MVSCSPGPGICPALTEGAPWPRGAQATVRMTQGHLLKPEGTSLAWRQRRLTAGSWSPCAKRLAIILIVEMCTVSGMQVRSAGFLSASAGPGMADRGWVCSLPAVAGGSAGERKVTGSRSSLGWPSLVHVAAGFQEEEVGRPQYASASCVGWHCICPYPTGPSQAQGQPGMEGG